MAVEVALLLKMEVASLRATAGNVPLKSSDRSMRPSAVPLRRLRENAGCTSTSENNGGVREGGNMFMLREHHQSCQWLGRISSRGVQCSKCDSAIS